MKEYYLAKSQVETGLILSFAPVVGRAPMHLHVLRDYR